MRDLPTKFIEHSRKKDAKPALLVSLQTSLFYAELSTQADWSASWSSSNVDWTPSPPDAGDVALAATSAVLTEQTSQNVFSEPLVWDNQLYQSFQ